MRFSSKRHAASRRGLSRVLTPCVLLAAASCNDAAPPAPVTEQVGLWRVDTPRGPVTLPYRNVGGWAIADDDIILGRADQVRPRDFHIAGQRWSRGIIPYVWDVSDDPDCGVDLQRFCEDEWLYLTQGVGPGGMPIWEEFKRHVVAETSLSLVDVTACYNDPSCDDYLEPGSYIFVRRPVPRTDDDNQDACSATNNTTKQITKFTLADIPGETWQLDIAGDAWAVIGSGLGVNDAPAIVSALTSDPNYAALPIVASFDGATVILAAKAPEDIAITLIGANTGTANVDESGNDSCVGAKGCGNTDCDAGFVCVDTWPYDATYALGDTGFCQQSGGIATLGPEQPNDTAERFIGIPTSWFHGRRFNSMAHELMHVAGFVHEHQRPDNYDAVFTIADTSCELIPSSTDLDKNTNYALYGWSSPLDWASSVMYSSNSLCLPTPECKDMCLNADQSLCPDNICDPNPNAPGLAIIRPSGWFEGYDRLGNTIDRGELRLSYKDQDALRTIVGNAFAQAFVEGQCAWCTDDGDKFPEQAWSGPELHDAFASSLAIGRFGDEDNGVLVGIPGEEEDWLDIKSGAATVWEGNRYMLELANDAPGWETTNPHLPAIPILAADQFLVPQEFAADFPLIEAGDRFGHALAAVDFDGDGIDEIAVGAPQAGAGDAGRVYIYRTGNAKRKHSPWQVLEPDNDDGAWEFGHALAAGDFAGKDNDDSCGSRHRKELAVGSPKMVDTHGNQSGAVYVYRWNPSVKSFQRRDIIAQHSQDNQRFGHAIAAADLDGDHRDGLVVGAPLYGEADVGRAYFYESDSPADACHMQLQYKGFRVGPVANGRLGSAIAAGDFLRGTGEFIFSPDDVAVGAPRPGNAGFVELFKGTGAPLAVNTPFAPFDTLTQVADGIDADESGDEFGYALAVTEYSYVPSSAQRPASLFIGTPGETNVANVQVGAVYQVEYEYDVPGTIRTYRGDVRVTEDCPAGEDFGCDLSALDSAWAGRFGAAIAASRRILVIGDPSYDMPFDEEDPTSDVGAARIYVRERDPQAVDAWYLMRWFTEENDWPNPVGGWVP